MRIVPFEPSHLIGVTLHPKQAGAQALVNGGLLSGACTALDGDDVVAVGGVTETEDGMAGWMLFTGRYRPKHLLPILRAVRCGMAALKMDDLRVVADVAGDNIGGARMAAMLGFVPLRQVVIDGRIMSRMAA